MSEVNGKTMSHHELGSAVRRLRIHDVSPTLAPDLPVFFMYQSPQIRPLYEHSGGGAAANMLELAEHVGAHVDAPFHFDPEGVTVDALPADILLLRPFKKFDLTANDHQPGELVELEHLIAAAERGGFTLEDGDVAVLEFGWDRYLPGGADSRDQSWWGANEPGLSDAACEYLAELQVYAPLPAIQPPVMSLAARDRFCRVTVMLSISCRTA